MASLVWLIPALPFSAFVINIFLGKKLGENAGLVSVAASFFSDADFAVTSYAETGANVGSVISSPARE